MELPVIKILSFGSLELHENFVISTVNEGVIFNMEKFRESTDIIREHFGGRKFAYIANRKYSYSLDLMIYYEVSKIDNLIAEAIVTYPDAHLNTYGLEAQFIDRPFQEFTSIHDALTWVRTLF